MRCYWIYKHCERPVVVNICSCPNTQFNKGGITPIKVYGVVIQHRMFIKWADISKTIIARCIAVNHFCRTGVVCKVITKGCWFVFGWNDCQKEFFNMHMFVLRDLKTKNCTTALGFRVIYWITKITHSFHLIFFLVVSDNFLIFPCIQITLPAHKDSMYNNVWWLGSHAISILCKIHLANVFVCIRPQF